jgi:hypothetical protein
VEKVLVAQPDRAALVAGLRALAEFYEQHVEVPVVLHPDFHHCVVGRDDEVGAAEVRAVAAALGMRATADTHRTEVITWFGSVEFKAFYLTRTEMADYADQMSYATVVQPSSRRLLSGAGLE